MAILTGITNAVRANLAGAASKAVSSVASDIKSIGGLNPTGSNSALGKVSNLAGGTSSNILTYPINVDTDPQQGHYIMFFINTRDEAKLKARADARKSFQETQRQLVKEFGTEGADFINASANAYDPSPQSKGLINSANSFTQKSIVASKLPTVRLEKSIALYMPPNVQVSYDVKYAEEEIGSVALLASGVIDAFSQAKGTEAKLGAGFDALTGSNLKEIANQLGNKALDTVAPGAAALQALSRGSVITPRMEMMFEGVGRRNFSYTFMFTPKSEQEAQIVEEIIRHFKFYAMPKYTNPTTRREMDIPGTFDIEYMYNNGKRNNFINRVSTCFLKSVAVQYGADRYTAYEETETLTHGSGSPPQRSSLTLSFGEIETLSQQHIDEGY